MRSLNIPAAALFGAALALLGLLTAMPAGASLGADTSSIEADRVALGGALGTSTASSGFEVREITTPAGVHVREYLSAQGKVFALAWQGPVRPDLRQMLGGYYTQYAQAVGAAHAGSHRHLAIRQPGLIVEWSGRMRAFYGRAWDPGLLPANFSLADLR